MFVGLLRQYCVWLQTGRPELDARQRQRIFPLSSILFVHTSSEAHPASYPMGTGGSFPGGKARPGRDADQSLPPRAEVKKR
jgi:hypothetical protein